MTELEDQLRGVLEDPQQMAQIMDLARSLMGGGAGEPPPPEAGGLTEKLGALMKQPSGGGGKQELLQAIKPWLSEKRQRKVERAIRISRMAHLAKIALKDMGGEGRA